MTKSNFLKISYAVILMTSPLRTKNATKLSFTRFSIPKKSLFGYASAWMQVRSSFICQGTSTSRQRSDLCGLRVMLPPVITSLTTHR